MRKFFAPRFDWLDAALALFFCSSSLRLVYFFDPTASRQTSGILLFITLLFSLIIRRLVFGPPVRKKMRKNLTLGLLSNFLVLSGTLTGVAGIVLIDQSYSLEYARRLGYTPVKERKPSSELGVSAEDVDFKALHKEVEKYQKGELDQNPGSIKSESRRSLLQTLSRHKLKAFVTLCIGILLVILGGVIERTRELRS